MAAFRWGCAGVLALALCAGAGQAAPPHGRQAVAAPPPATAAHPLEGAAPEMRIAAVVNDEVISVFDVISRMRMIMISSNIADTPETRQKLFPQVLHSLIDEKLELEEAKRENVSATDAEIKKALDAIEKQNNMKPGQLNEFLKSRGIDRGAMVDQLTAGIVWTKLVRRRTAETINISDDEIDQAYKRAKEHANEPESHVAEIFLSVDNPAQDSQVQALAERLSQQMRQGARFSAVAQQFSQSATAAVGGDLGWVRADALPEKLGQAVSQLQPGQLSAPIRTRAGYYLLLVIDRRTGTTGSEQNQVYDIVQVVFPVSAQASEAARRAAISAAQSVRSAATDCPSLLKIGKERAPQLSSEGKLLASTISPQMRALVTKLPVGQASEPIVQKNGVGVIMVCSKPTAGGGLTRDEVAESLLRQRLDTVARSYLRDLRRNAYVDVRV